MAWLLNISEYKSLLGKYLTPLGTITPHNHFVAASWLDARKKYKGKILTEVMTSAFYFFTWKPGFQVDNL